CTVDPEGCSFADPPARFRVDFTGGQTTVGVWVGNHDASRTRSVRLTAFDGTGNEVGHQDVTMAPSSPVNHHLAVTSGSANIVRFEVTAIDSFGIFDILLDDVEFTAAG